MNMQEVILEKGSLLLSLIPAHQITKHLVDVLDWTCQLPVWIWKKSICSMDELVVGSEISNNYLSVSH